MYNSLHYTYYLYIVMYYRNNLVSLGEEYDKSGKLHLICAKELRKD